jgi:hypothetical protein
LLRILVGKPTHLRKIRRCAQVSNPSLKLRAALA